MAKVYKTFRGFEFDEGMAHFGGVQEEISSVTGDASRKAHALLAEHRNEGHSFIETERSDLDGYVILNDERGLKAAMSIEYGRAPADPDSPTAAHDPFPDGMAGLFILHQATGLGGVGRTKHGTNFPRKSGKRRKRR